MSTLDEKDQQSFRVFTQQVIDRLLAVGVEPKDLEITMQIINAYAWAYSRNESVKDCGFIRIKIENFLDSIGVKKDKPG